MPKHTNEYYQYGFVRAKLGEIQAIANKLSEHDGPFSMDRLDDIQDTVERIHTEIQSNLRGVDPVEVNDLLREYEALSIIADRELLNRRLEAERPVELSPITGTVRRVPLERKTVEQAVAADTKPRRKVIVIPAGSKSDRSNPGPSRVSEFVQKLNEYKAMEKKKKPKKKKAPATFSFGDEFDEPAVAEGPIDPYASDNDIALTPTLCSAAQPSAGFKPIKFPSNDLRNKLALKQRVLERRSSNESDHELRYRPREPERPRYTPLYDYRGPSSSVGSIRGSSYSVGSISSVRSYQSSKQEPLEGPIRGVLYPPRARCLPAGIHISRKDPNIIGMSEFFVQEINTKTCILCKGHHRLFNCKTFIRMNLQERWYFVLTHGVCLYCLYPGHSSFSCSTRGNCSICGVRHNTKLCPRKEYNQDEN